MENEETKMNQTETTTEETIPATPVNEEMSADDTINNIPSASEDINATSQALDTLNDEERGLYESVKEMSEEEISTMPPSIRQEIADLKAKLADASDAKTDDADAEPQTTVEKNTDADTDTEKPAEDAEKAPVSTDDIIRLLTEENRKLTARYDTLQGKYNAEIKAKKIDSESDPDKAAGENKPAAEEDAIAKGKAELAEKYGLDDDVMDAVSDMCALIMKHQNINRSIDPVLEQKMRHIVTQQENAEFDRVIRQVCNGISLDDLENHPLLRSCAEGMADNNGITAWDAIIEYKNNHDHANAAMVLKQVVDDMDSKGLWDFNGRHSAKPEPPFAAQTQKPSSAGQEKPVTAVPHSVSGVGANALQTGNRTLEDVSREYDALDRRFRLGDHSVVPRMTQLSKEFSKLAASTKP